MPRQYSVRTAARAVIIEKGRLLAIAMKNQKGHFYVLPGGGQRLGETLQQTLHRECWEEIGCPIEIGRLAYVREYIGKNHKFSPAHHSFHQLEVVFRARLAGPCAEKWGSSRDNLQVGISWLPLRELATFPIYPQVLLQYIEGDDLVIDPAYLGDIN